MRSIGACWLAACLALGLGACNGNEKGGKPAGDDGTPCLRTRDCPGDLVCFRGTCQGAQPGDPKPDGGNPGDDDAGDARVPSDERQGDSYHCTCPGLQTCSGVDCLEPSVCISDLDCLDGRECADGACAAAGAPTCADYTDCENGQVCVGSTCTGCTNDSDCPGRQSCDCPGGPPCSPPGACLAPARCTEDADCAQAKVCVQTCDTLLPVGCQTASTCGDGDVDSPPEFCDPGLIPTETCFDDLGYSGGTLACKSDCTGFDESACTRGGACADDGVQSPEVCDASDHAGEDCSTLQYDSGDLACEPDCSAFDTTSCVTTAVCGDGTKEGPELCDTGDVGAADCASLFLEAVAGPPPTEVACGGLCDDPICTNDGYEPNNNPGDVSQPTGSGGYALMLCEFERDLVLLDTSEGDGLLVRLVFDEDWGRLEAKLILVNGSEVTLDPPVAQLNDESILFAMPQVPAGDVFLDIQSLDGAANPVDVEISIVAGGFCLPDTSEPNDTSIDARVVTSGLTSFSVTVCPWDEDWFVMTAAAAGNLNIAFDTTLGAPPILALYEGDTDNRVRLDTTDNDPKNMGSATTQDGVYYLRIYNAEPTTTSGGTLTINLP